MRIAIALLGAVLLPFAVDAQAAPGPIFARVKGFAEQVRLDTAVVWHRVHGSPEQTLRNARAVLDSLQVAMEVVDSAAARIHHTGFDVRRRLAGSPVSNFVRCGMGFSGDYADSWRVNIAYALYVRPDSVGSRLGMALVAGATDIEGASKPPLGCATTGRFEALMARLLTLRALR